MRKINVFVFVFGILLSTNATQAQDSLNDPRILNAIPVSKEPRHHDVLDNQWVRVLDVV